MRIYITGPVASGKSTLANRLGALTGVPVYHLDELVHIRDENTPLGNRKRPQEERDRLFSEILTKPNWIMEDTGRDCFASGMSAADTIILLEPPLAVRYYRIIRRFIRQRLKMEPCHYTPNLRMLMAMFRWTNGYQSSETRKMLHSENNNVIVLSSSKEQSAWTDKQIRMD